MAYDIGAFQSGDGYDIGAFQSDAGSGSQELTFPSLVGPRAFGDHTVALSLQVATFPSLVGPRAFGTMVIAGPVTLPSLVGPRAFGTMVIAGPVTLPGIPTNQKFGDMIVAGPLTLPSIVSPSAFGTMSITQPQEVELPSLVGSQAFGTMSVSHVQPVLLPSLLGPRAFGSHTVQGASQGVLLPSLRGPRAFGVLAVQGGVRSIRIFIGGVDRTSWLVPLSTFFDSQQRGRWNANFDFYIPDNSWAPALGQTVLILDYGRRHFAGCISEFRLDRAPKTLTKTFFRCAAVDKNGRLDARVATKTYAPTTDAADVFRDLVDNFLDGEGITYNNVPASLGAIGTEIILNQDTITAAFDRIRDTMNVPWWVDPFSDLHAVEAEDREACPFSITQTSRNWRNLAPRWTLQDYATEVFVRTNRAIKPGSPGEGGQQTGPIRTETFTLPYQPSVDRGFVFGALITQLPVYQVVSLKLTRAGEFTDKDQPVHIGTEYINWSKVWWYFPGTPYITPPVPEQDVPLPDPPIEGDVPETGDVVTLTYIPIATNAVVDVGDPLTPTTPDGDPLAPGTDGNCGSGRYQSVVQVNDLEYQDDLDRLASAAKARKSIIPVQLEFETDVPGAQVGQQLAVDLPLIYLPNRTMLITGVTGQSLAVNLGHDSTFRWTIRATTTEGFGNWLSYYERIIRRSDHPKPIPQYEEAEFILAPDGSLAQGTVITNPAFVKRTGRLVEAWAAFTNPSEDQNVVLDVEAVGFGLLLGPSKLVVPAGSTAIARTTEFYGTAPFVYERTILRAIASYDVFGPNPLPAANGTLMLRWEIG